MQQNKNYLFLFTIGPVQSFIAQARKTQDLWSGSYLLSYLINEARNYAINSLKIKAEDFVFPVEENKLDSEIASLPNRLLFITDNPEENGKKLEDYLYDKFEDILKFSFEKLKKTEKNKEFNYSDLKILSKDFLKIYWVAIPYNKLNHKTIYHKLESLLGARKNIRNFNYTKEMGIKCPICGEREAIHLKNKNTRKEVKSFWEKISKKYPKINENETLCPICLAKRFFPVYLQSKKDNELDLNDISFPSTSEIAVSYYKFNLLEENKLKEIESKFPRVFLENKFMGRLVPKNAKMADKNKTIDGHWFFKDNYTEKEYEKYFSNTKLTKEEFLKIPKNINFAKVSTYYAVIFMDGDSMGSKISKLSYDEHKNFSKVLADFSSKIVPGIVEKKYLGKLIYAGGDDVAALVNLNDLFDVIKEIKEEFSSQLNSNRDKYPSIEDDFTISAGVCVSHYKTPFSLTLQKAREMEKKAKEFKNLIGDIIKNSVGIIILTHGGNNKETIFPWNFNDKSSVELSKRVQELISKEIISKDFIYVLKNEFLKIISEKGTLSNEIDDKKNFFTIELYRIIKRKSKQKLSSKEINNLKDDLIKFFEEGLNYNVLNLISFLEITNVISRESQL